MTDEIPQEEPGDQDEPSNAGTSEDATDPPESGSIQYIGSDGEWHDIEVEPKKTGDPELDAIWSMSFHELERILEDEAHPLHEKAKQVSAEAAGPIVDAANDIFRPLTESFAKGLDMSKIAASLAPKLDMQALFPALNASSWFAKLVPDLPKYELPEGLAEQLFQNSRLAPLPAPEPPVHRLINFEAVEPPDASLTEIKEAADARAHEMRGRQIEILSNLLMEARASTESGKEALDLSRQALEATRESVSEARGSKIAAWTAAAVGAIGLVATVVLGIINLIAQ
ncbi:hypothetical protein [Phytoactinopolyspora limicola]|uniref:hypothetical protein n=1 Tax=Phytoactinopolyspora limicola TaxID=2715536 RepID=UPI00140C6B71|nr:hypothetical protein [Phytoactinopolyspora limicola]